MRYNWMKGYRALTGRHKDLKRCHVCNGYWVKPNGTLVLNNIRYRICYPCRPHVLDRLHRDYMGYKTRAIFGRWEGPPIQ